MTVVAAPGHEEELAELVSLTAAAERVASGCSWSEGPVYVPAIDSVLWSDIPNDRIMSWSESNGQSEYATGVEFTNGHTLDSDGSIVSCSHGNRRIERRTLDGEVTPIIGTFNGRRMNSPNDVVIKSDGTIWFTDPPYGIASDHEGHKAESELGANHVFRFDPVLGDLTAVTSYTEEPNGLAFSPDEAMLYVSDTSAALRSEGGNHHIVAFDVVDGRALANPELFAVIEPGLPDGFRVAETGHLITSSGGGLQVFEPSGTCLGRIDIPEKTSNCVFGGTDGKTLFITASTSLYRIQMNVEGAA